MNRNTLHLLLVAAAALMANSPTNVHAFCLPTRTAIVRSASSIQTTSPLLYKTTIPHRPAPLTSPLPSSSSISDSALSSSDAATDDDSEEGYYSLNPADGVNLMQNLGTDEKSLLSAGALVLLDIAFRRLFQTFQIAFPSSLGGCCILLFTMLGTGTFGRQLYEILQPGAALLAKWLPVFFVPSLVTLPLVGSVGSSVEVRVVSVVENLETAHWIPDVFIGSRRRMLIFRCAIISSCFFCIFRSLLLDCKSHGRDCGRFLLYAAFYCRIGGGCGTTQQQNRRSERIHNGPSIFQCRRQI